MKWLVHLLCLAAMAIFSGCSARQSIDVMQAGGNHSPLEPDSNPEEAAIKRAVYDDIINRPHKENVVFALPDRDYAALADYYRRSQEIVRPSSAIIKGRDGTYFSAKERLPGASLLAQIVEKRDKVAILLLSTSRGARESVWRYNLKDSGRLDDCF
jgi:hypothetical protein